MVKKGRKEERKEGRYGERIDGGRVNEMDG
jgi:hypothetical protein